jgi:hypothetical protein
MNQGARPNAMPPISFMEYGRNRKRSVVDYPGMRRLGNILDQIQSHESENDHGSDRSLGQMLLEDIPASQQGQKKEKNFALMRGEYLFQDALYPTGWAISIVVVVLPKALLIPNDS